MHTHPPVAGRMGGPFSLLTAHGRQIDSGQLATYDGARLVEADEMEGVLADVDVERGD